VDIVTGMVTRIHQHARVRYDAKEHRKARKLSAAALAERLGVHEKSVYRVEKQPWRLDRQEKRDEWARAIGLESGQELERPPGAEPKRPSLDPIARDLEEEDFKVLHDLAVRMAARKSA
jgi:transcriptional regulator with XRE-family HTH domain